MSRGPHKSLRRDALKLMVPYAHHLAAGFTQTLPDFAKELRTLADLMDAVASGAAAPGQLAAFFAD